MWGRRSVPGGYRLLYDCGGLPERSTTYEPISPVKNMTSVARNSHMATLPGVTGRAWTVGRAIWPRSTAVSDGYVAACAISRHPRSGGADSPQRHEGHKGFT